jgi:hypothetical protein
MKPIAPYCIAHLKKKSWSYRPNKVNKKRTQKRQKKDRTLKRLLEIR